MDITFFLTLNNRVKNLVRQTFPGKIIRDIRRTVSIPQFFILVNEGARSVFHRGKHLGSLLEGKETVEGPTVMLV